MDESERAARAEARRSRAVLNRAKLGYPEPDLSPVSGAEAVSLAVRLTLESWNAAGMTLPRYARSEIPVRFVPGRLD